MTTEQKSTKKSHELFIQRIYVKDISFESPKAPQVFTKDWKPDMHLDVHTHHQELGDNNYDVTVELVVTVKSQDNIAFLADVKQSGIFLITGLNEEELQHTLYCFCANTIFPYARECISDLVTRGGFPQLLLPPVNFDAMYTAKLKEIAKEKEATGSIN